MNREIQEKDSVQILETEEDHRGYALKATFDGETYNSYSFHEEASMMDTSDYYFSE